MIVFKYFSNATFRFSRWLAFILPIIFFGGKSSHAKPFNCTSWSMILKIYNTHNEFCIWTEEELASFAFSFGSCLFASGNSIPTLVSYFALNKKRKIVFIYRSTIICHLMWIISRSASTRPLDLFTFLHFYCSHSCVWHILWKGIPLAVS